MKRLQLLLLLAALSSASAGAETTAAAGGGVAFDSSTTAAAAPTIVSTLAGDLSWLPTDSLGAFLDWSAAGSYQPLDGSVSALAAITASSSYLSGKFLGKLSLSSAANLSSADPAYGAVSSELLLSYGGPALTVFTAPRFALVEDSGISMDLGGRVGMALLLADRVLVTPSLEAGISVPGGISSGWFLVPAAALSWYAGGGFTLDLAAGYRRSYSVRLTPLVTGGAALPLDTYQRGFFSAETTWVGKRGVAVAAGIPISCTEKTYDAYDGGIDLGVPTWLVEMRPTVQVSLPLTTALQLVFTVDGRFDVSNNTVEQAVAVSTTAQLQLHLD